MHLQTATITGFRSFARSQRFTLEPGLNCIIGPGRVGKSAILEALLWALGVSAGGDSEPGLFFHGSESLRPAKEILVALEFRGAPGHPHDLSVSRFAARDQALSHYRVNNADYGPGAFPEDYEHVASLVRRVSSSDEFCAAAHGNSGRAVLLLDEIDSQMAPAQFERYSAAIEALRHSTQLIVVTHRKEIMASADHVVGVTMEEYGLSTIVPMRLVAGPNRGGTRRGTSGDDD